jgi:hypothetical protein
VNTDTDFDNCGGCGDGCDAETADACSGGECQCGGEPACTGDLVCVSGLCVVRVTPGDLGDWTVAATEEVEFVVGPETPPLGVGSVELRTPGGGKATLRNQAFLGLAIADLETLIYSTYQQNGSTTEVVVPAVKFEVLYGPANSFTTLIFEPTYSVNSDVLPDVWQAWDLLSEDARWWSSRAIPADDPVICAFDCFVPWQDVVDAIPDAAITNVLIETGSGTPNAVGNVDALNINGVIFDFDPDPE